MSDKINADVNGDGKVDIHDVNETIGAVMIDSAEEYAKQLANLFLGNGLSLQTILLMAIEFGQQHHAWVSVKKELPEPNTYKEGKTFPSVLVCLTDGYIDTDAYDTDNKVWCKYKVEVEYWMPLPTPPVKKGGQDAS